MLSSLPRDIVLAAVIVASLMIAACGAENRSPDVPRTPEAAPITDGTTTFVLRAEALESLRSAGVRVLPLSPARWGTGRSRSIILPVTGGSFDRRLSTGRVLLRGGLRFVSDEGGIDVRNLIIDGLREIATARVGASRRPFFNLELGELHRGTVFGNRMTVIGSFRAELHEAGALVLSDAFGDPDPLVPGSQFGRLLVAGEAPAPE